MSNSTIPTKRIYYLGYIIEVTAVCIDRQWFPLMQILEQSFAQIHPWQIPAVKGSAGPTSAMLSAIPIGHDIINRDIANPNTSLRETLILKALERAIHRNR
jgi:hypothetical protein